MVAAEVDQPAALPFASRISIHDAARSWFPGVVSLFTGSGRRPLTVGSVLPVRFRSIASASSLAIAAVAMLLLAFPGPADAFKLGVNAGNATGEQSFDRMVEARLGNVRLPIYWRRVEPTSKGVRTWLGADAQVAAAARAGATLEVVLAGAPGWALSDIARGARGRLDTVPIRSTAAFAEFAGAMASRYGAAGTFWVENPTIPRRPVATWQVWNEPNLSHFAGGAYRDPGRYASLFKASADRIMRADRTARVIPAGLAMGGRGRHDPSSYLRALWSRLGASRVRGHAWSLHVYKPTAKEVSAGVASFRRLMNGLGCPGCSLVLGEFGFGAGARSSGCVRCVGTEAAQVKATKDLLVLLKRDQSRNRLTDVRWFQWGDSGERPAPLDGLTRPDGSGRPVLSVLSSFAAAN
jgi:hypothetical protein